MVDRKQKTEVLRDVRMIFNNFAGREGRYNTEGDRNFHVVIPADKAIDMREEGWRIKQSDPREEGVEGDYHLKVNVNYKKGRPPRVVLMSSQNTPKQELGSDEVALLDAADISKCDMVINGWWNDMSGGGYSGYLKSLYVWLNQDELELLYSGTPAGQSPNEEAHDEEMAYA